MSPRLGGIVVNGLLAGLAVVSLLPLVYAYVKSRLSRRAGG